MGLFGKNKQKYLGAVQQGYSEKKFRNTGLHRLTDKSFSELMKVQAEDEQRKARLEQKLRYQKEREKAYTDKRIALLRKNLGLVKSNKKKKSVIIKRPSYNNYLNLLD